ncbi:hypothetical protein E8E14_006424 [Neopestalotiopsis sp. 37M]|nr:hypothetical protein E8E14_006424 [Neopestalotiopsis sp. 37M]
MPPASGRALHSAFVVVDGSFLEGGEAEIFGTSGSSGCGYQVESPRIGVLLVGRRWELPIRTMVRPRSGQGASEALGFSIVVSEDTKSDSQVQCRLDARHEELVKKQSEVTRLRAELQSWETKGRRYRGEIKAVKKQLENDSEDEESEDDSESEQSKAPLVGSTSLPESKDPDPPKDSVEAGTEETNQAFSNIKHFVEAEDCNPANKAKTTKARFTYPFVITSPFMSLIW